MKATKALKKLAKIEALLSNVSERYAASDHNIHALLEDAKDSMNRVKEAVTLQKSPAAKKAPAVIKKLVVKKSAARKAMAKKSAATTPEQAAPALVAAAAHTGTH